MIELAKRLVQDRSQNHDRNLLQKEFFFLGDKIGAVALPVIKVK